MSSKKNQSTEQSKPAADQNANAELNDSELEAVTGGAKDYLLVIEGIKGEAGSDGHKNEIDVYSFSWGVSQTGTALKQ